MVAQLAKTMFKPLSYKIQIEIKKIKLNIYLNCQNQQHSASYKKWKIL